MASKHYVGRNNEHGVDKCPICHRPDYCTTRTVGDYYEVICRRNGQKSNIMGHDGRFYIYVGDTKETMATKFVEANTYARVKGISYDKSLAAEPIIVKKPLETEKPMIALPDKRLNRIYRRFMSLLCLEQWHKEQLLKDGWTEELIIKSGVRSLPVFDGMPRRAETKNQLRFKIAATLLSEFGDLKGVPGFYVKESKKKPDKYYWTFSTASGMLFPIMNTEGLVKRLRIRLDEVTNRSGKYRPFNSFFINNETGKNTYLNGTPCGDHFSCFFDQSMKDIPSYWNVLRVTEGWKKGFIISEKLKMPTISLPGVAFLNLLTDEFIAFLIGQGVNYVCIDFDADYKTNEFVALELFKIKDRLSKYFHVGVSDWNKNLGKGIDDFLLTGGQPGYIQI